jgi:hypothetical protein
MSKPTHEDANLILRLYEMRREATMREARNWFVAGYKFKTLEDMSKACPPGSKENAYARMVTSYWDMVASFITSGVLNEELFFQSNRELLLVYMRVEPILGDIRKAFGDQNYMGHLETVGKSYIAYLDRTSPGAAPSFKARVG